MATDDRSSNLSWAAEEIALIAGAIRLCSACEEEFVKCHDPDTERKAYLIGVEWLQSKRIESDTEALARVIAEVLEQTPTHCRNCGAA